METTHTHFEVEQLRLDGVSWVPHSTVNGIRKFDTKEAAQVFIEWYYGLPIPPHACVRIVAVTTKVTRVVA